MNPTGSPAARTSRRYTSTRRDRQAEQTRAEVVQAAVRLFARTGWAGTTLAAIAAEADVAVETIYTGFASKKALLQAAMDVAIAGDTEPVPLLEREEAHRLRELPPRQRLHRSIEWLGRIYQGPAIGVWFAMLEAAASDPEVAAWCDEHEQRRYDTLEASVATVFELTLDSPTLDAIWAVASIEVYAKLTRQRGWTPDQWQTWIISTIESLTS
jgi:AcrR family transcriptional regulator